MSTIKSKDSTNTLILFGDKRPDAFGLSQLYDPDIHGSDPTASGKIVPAVNSLVTDESTNILYRVASVNEVYKSTLVPINYVNRDDSSSEDVSSVINYGNTRFVLYYDDRVKPTKLEIDGKLYVLGSQNTEYRLLRKLSNGTEEIISLYINADEQYSGNRIPLSLIDEKIGTVKLCTNCHTLFPIQEGEQIILQIFNSHGQQTLEYTLTAIRSIILNDLISDGNPIVNFDAESTQMSGNEFYLYENQSPTALNIAPFITYADGSTLTVAIDNKTCFMYGFEKDNIPSYPGRRFKILIKKYLSTREITTIDTFDKTKRFISCEKWINIVKNNTEYSLKLSVIPMYNNATSRYDLKFIAYTEEREHVYDVTPYCTINEDFEFDNYNEEQYLKVIFNSNEIFNNNVTTMYQQSWWITLRAPGAFEAYIIKDSKNDEFAFGVESSTYKRPVIHFDTTLEQYFIPTSVFKNKEAFIEAFYTLSRPPYDENLSIGPEEPTHFTIRGLDDLNVLITTPINVEEYSQVWNIVRNGNKNQLVGSQVLVEFLKLVGEEYKILYGVPVSVYESTTGYNRPGNNLRV